MVQLLNGKKLQDEIKQELRLEIEKLKDKTNKHPCLAIMQVGNNNAASNTYIKQKIIHSQDIGVIPIHIKLDEFATEEQVIREIHSLNNNPQVNGIIVQLPLPSHLDEFKIIEEIDPKKDVDCLTSKNIGLLHMQKPYVQPCTPSGIIEMLKRYNIELEGKNVLVIGRSNIVGRPIAELLTQSNCTVTLAHSKTQDLKRDLCGYDIIISAVGKPHFIKAEDLRHDEYLYDYMVDTCKELNEDIDKVTRKIVVIDVGMNRDVNGNLCGDVDYKDILEDKLTRVKAITPVPKGCGATTVASLLRNVVKTFKYQNNILD